MIENYKLIQFSLIYRPSETEIGPKLISEDAITKSAYKVNTEQTVI